MRLVTTCNKAGFDLYGHRMLDGFKLWPAGTELWWYTEGFKLPDDKPDGIVEIDIESLWGLGAFKEKHKTYVPPNYLFDVVRFSNKVYAAIDALQDYKGIGVWLDADCVTYKPIHDGFIEGHLNGGYLAMFKRKGMYTETGLWIMDCSNEAHVPFLDAWASWYEEGIFKDLANWTDCETLDSTVRSFEKRGMIKTVSLSGAFEKDMHPMAKAEIGKYIDHCKGNRKVAGRSPENEAHQ